jgi:hypothetical protein
MPSIYKALEQTPQQRISWYKETTAYNLAKK